MTISSSPARAGCQRHLVDRAGVDAETTAWVDVAEERDLAADTRIDGAVGAADDEVGLDTDAAELLDRVLGRLGLELARSAM
jgi:hypothetical protein